MMMDLVFEDKNNTQVKKDYPCLQDESIVLHGYFYDSLPFPETIYFVIGKITPPSEINKSNIGIFQYLKMYGSSAKYKGVIDRQGKQTIARVCLDIQLFGYEDFVLLKMPKDKYGVSRLSGEIVCRSVYDYIYPFSEYFFALEQDGKVGFMDVTGKIVIPIVYDVLPCKNENYYKFEKGKAKVIKCIDGYNYEFYIDHYGNQISNKSYIETDDNFFYDDSGLYDYSDSLDAFEGDDSNRWNID